MINSPQAVVPMFWYDRRPENGLEVRSQEASKQRNALPKRATIFRNTTHVFLLTQHIAQDAKSVFDARI
jgi:hypothetical protein